MSRAETLDEAAIRSTVRECMPMLRGAAESFSRCDRTDPIASELEAMGAEALWALRWYGLSLCVYREANWHLRADVRLALSARRGLESRVGWPSGGGDVAIAAAQAALHAEVTAEAMKANTYLTMLAGTVQRTGHPAQVYEAIGRELEGLQMAHEEIRRGGAS